MTDEKLRRNEMEFEIRLVREGDRPGLDRCHVHSRSFAAREFERGGTR